MLSLTKTLKSSLIGSLFEELSYKYLYRYKDKLFNICEYILDLVKAQIPTRGLESVNKFIHLLNLMTSKNEIDSRLQHLI
jgi:hypothetical protein